MRKSWPEERSEIAIWLTGYLSMYKKWVDKILDDNDTEVTKTKILTLLSDWIKQLEEMKINIIKMSDTVPEKPMYTDADEARMDIIGQNGNDGQHYEETDI
tara:strand:- start:2801 stop:3103 length:303 start_codon:yes stop_codon:yes gene_type:complete